MRKTTLVVNSISVGFFVCFLSYTFIARHHLDSIARAFVTEKTTEYSQYVVATATEVVASRFVKELLSNEVQAAIRNELATYHADPKAYVSDLTKSSKDSRIIPQKIKNPIIEKVALVKNEIRSFYDETLDELIADLRIFAFSNLLAGIASLALVYRKTSEPDRSFVLFSFGILASVLYCSYLYINGLTFFRILFRTHMGWWYPVMLCITIAVLFMDFWPPRLTKPKESADL